METKEMGSLDVGNLKVTEVIGPEDRGTEREREGKDPEGPERVHSGSRCCISGEGQGPCGHLGYPESGTLDRKQGLRTPLHEEYTEIKCYIQV